MADTRDADDSLELESLIRSAGNALQPSEDLRPRLLESARQRRELLSFQSLLQQAAILLLVGSLFTAVVPEPIGHSSAQEAAALGFDANASLTERTIDSRDPGWTMVESFTQLRRRRADLFRFDL